MRSLKTTTDVEKALNELQKTRADLAKLTGKANAKIATIRDEIAAEIAELEDTDREIIAAVEAWAEVNRNKPEIFPAGKKTLDLNAGTISIRASAPSLVLKKKFTTSKVVELLKKAGIALGIKQPEPEINKTAIKSLYDSGEIDDAQLSQLGLEFATKESINIELKTVEAYA